jgi:hypothetical protein
MVTDASKGEKRKRVGFISVFQAGYKRAKRLIFKPFSSILKYPKRSAYYFRIKQIALEVFINMNLIRFTHSWNVGILEDWNAGSWVIVGMVY